MSIFTSEDSGKFLGGVILYSFDNDERTKLTVSTEIRDKNATRHSGFEANMENAVACEITESGDFIDAPVTLAKRHIDTFISLKADGDIRPGYFDAFTPRQKEAVQYLVNRILANIGEVPSEEQKAEAKAREIGVHVSHCCAMHGCKYGDGEYCAVESKTHKQDYPCESCVDVEDAEAQIERLKEEIMFAKSLKKG